MADEVGTGASRTPEEGARPHFTPPSNGHAWPLVLTLPYSQVYPIGAQIPVLVCNTCGSLVYDLQAHAGWHDENDAKEPT